MLQKKIKSDESTLRMWGPTSEKNGVKRNGNKPEKKKIPSLNNSFSLQTDRRFDRVWRFTAFSRIESFAFQMVIKKSFSRTLKWGRVEESPCHFRAVSADESKCYGEPDLLVGETNDYKEPNIWQAMRLSRVLSLIPGI